MAIEFLYRRAVDVDLPPVLFIIHLDQRGETSFEYRCKHVNYIANSHVPREQEFLFIPYSVFTVLEADWKVRKRLCCQREGHWLIRSNWVLRCTLSLFPFRLVCAYQ